MERDNVGYRIGIAVRISTHTLTWSVTYVQSQPDVKIDISTHTLTWSVTKKMPHMGHIAKFQLTRSRGA